MEITQTGVVDSRNVMWRNYGAHTIPFYTDQVYELDFKFKRDLDPVAALQKISEWHHHFEKALAEDQGDDGFPSSVLFVCNQHEMFREYEDFIADFRGILTFAHKDTHYAMTEIFPEIACSGFRVSFRSIPLSVYASAHKAQLAWLASGQGAALEATEH